MNVTFELFFRKKSKASCINLYTESLIQKMGHDKYEAPMQIQLSSSRSRMNLERLLPLVSHSNLLPNT